MARVWDIGTRLYCDLKSDIPFNIVYGAILLTLMTDPKLRNEGVWRNLRNGLKHIGELDKVTPGSDEEKEKKSLMGRVLLTIFTLLSSVGKNKICEPLITFGSNITAERLPKLVVCDWVYRIDDLFSQTQKGWEDYNVEWNTATFRIKENQYDLFTNAQNQSSSSTPSSSPASNRAN